MNCRRKIDNVFILLVMAVFGVGLAPHTARAEISDIDITRAVERQIREDPSHIDLNTLDVATADGIVTLSGTVDTLLAADRAVAVAQTVRGVRSVVNRIVITPVQRSDKDIKKDVQRVLLYDPLSESWQVDVKVKNGKVTLYGTVDSWAERDIIGRIAKGVRGVAAFENNIAVDYNTHRTDEEIREDIVGRLRWDALVDDALVKVEVKDGKVVLNGTVGSAAERTRAHRDAWVAGAKSVDSSGLEVKWWARDKNLRKDKYALQPDDMVQEAIKDAFLFDPRVRMFEIGIVVDEGRVTLSGTVNNLLAKRAAGKDARNTVGVWRVNNYIKVQPHTPTDKEVADNIRDALLLDPYVNRYEVKVSVRNGQAYLSGVVDTNFEKARADLIAAGIYGVTEVHNRIIVLDNRLLPYNPYVDRWDTRHFGWSPAPYPIIPDKSDKEIKQDIEDEFFWSPFVDGDDIQVTVDRGVATLTGTVDSWGEYNAAFENALEGGAVMVDNELAVENRP